MWGGGALSDACVRLDCLSVVSHLYKYSDA